jgi:hypothetical protein
MGTHVREELSTPGGSSPRESEPRLPPTERTSRWRVTVYIGRERAEERRRRGTKGPRVGKDWRMTCVQELLLLPLLLVVVVELEVELEEESESRRESEAEAESESELEEG